jgi:hypothetical protein
MADKRFSRRDMLRNIGIVGVGAWAVPVLTSLPAQASTGGTNPCKHIGGNCNVGFTSCGTCSSDVGDGSFCFEFIDKLGVYHGSKTKCAEDVFCAEVSTCASKADCARGEYCITDNGCDGCTQGAIGVCSPKCKTGSLRRGARKTRPGARRTATMAA